VQIDLAALPDDPDLLQRMLREVVPELQAENEKLWQLIQRLLRHRYGPRSEKLDLDQLQLVLEDAEQSAAESDAAKDAAEPAERRRRIEVANRNRGALPAHLPRYEVVIDVENKQCPCCGGALHVIGDDRSEMLDLVPAQLRVKVVCRPRYGCRACEGTVVQAPAPERPIDGGMATEALVAHIVVSKFCDSLPLYRQAQMLKRQGITLDRSTLSSWVGRACWWLTPLYELVLGTVLSTDKVFADETTLPVLEPGKGRTKTGGFGATRSMTGHGQARPIRQQPMSTPRTAGASIRQRTWRHSEAPCRSTVMPGSAIWLMRAGMPRSAWRSVGRMRGGRFTSSTRPTSHRSPPGSSSRSGK
jgi:transposase